MDLLLRTEHGLTAQQLREQLAVDPERGLGNSKAQRPHQLVVHEAAGIARFVRFVRFLHRNAALGWVSHVDELIFLQTPDSGF